MYCLLTAKTLGITHFLLKSYNTTRTKTWRSSMKGRQVYFYPNFQDTLRDRQVEKLTT